jgi:hypothetical protein
MRCSLPLALATALALSSGAWAASVARAQPAPPACRVDAELDLAQEALEAAQFEAAVQALDRASRCPSSRDALVRTLVLRALVAYADERLGALEEAVRALVSLGLSERPQGLPPPVARRYEEVRASQAPIALLGEAVVSVRGGSRRIGIAPRVTGDATGLVRRVEVRARLPGQRFRLLEGDLKLELPHLDAARVEYVLVAYGPGDALVASQGSEDSPGSLRVEAAPRDTRGFVAAIVVAGVLLVVAGAAVGVAAWLTDGFRNDDVRVRPP